MKLAVAIIACNEVGETLFLNRATEPLGFGLPGGKVDAGEELLEAAVREFKEETGLDIKPYNLVLHKVSSSVNNALIIFSYVLQIPLNTKQVSEIVLSEGEHSEFKFISLTGILKGVIDSRDKLAAGTFELL